MSSRRDFCRLASLGALATLPATRALAARQVAAPAPPPPSPLRIAVDCARTAQEIAGFGASGAFHMARVLKGFPDDERARVLDLLFSTRGAGAGLSMVRNIIPNGGRLETSIEPSTGQWNWATDDDQIWLMRQAATRGCTRFVSTAWTPPAWMKTNRNIVGGRLSTDKYRDYAEYLAQYVLGYRRQHGLEIYAISPQNEPDVTVKYASCYWNGEEYRNFVKGYLGPAWRRLNVPALVMLGEPSTWTEAPVVPALEDDQARDAVDIVAAHAYFGDNKVPGVALADRIGAFATAQRYRKPIWQTEVSSFNANDAGIDDALYWAKLLHFHLAEDNVSGWFYWWLVSPRNDREALLQLDPRSQGWMANKRLFALGQYSRFVRPGAQRVAATVNPAPEVYVSAYRQGAGQLAVVAINDNDMPISANLAVANFAPKQAQAFRTSVFEELSPLPAPPLQPAAAPATAALSATLMPHSITTYVLS